METSEILVTILQSLDGFAFRIELGQVCEKWPEFSVLVAASYAKGLVIATAAATTAVVVVVVVVGGGVNSVVRTR